MAIQHVKHPAEGDEAAGQYASLPYRLSADGALEIMLVTSRDTGRWVLPKGWPINGLPPYLSAAREAYEEAGLIGSNSEQAIGHYRYIKRSRRGDRDVMVSVYPMAVHTQLDDWPEKAMRKTRWFAPDAAADAVDEADLSVLLRTFVPRAQADLAEEA